MICAEKLRFVFGVTWIISSVSAEEVDLIDTRRATTDLNWISSPRYGWNELSSPDETGEIFRTFQVCYAPNERNWLATNLIELEYEQTSVFVEIKFNIRPCQKPAPATCKETFNLFYAETNKSLSAGATNFSSSIFSKIATVAADQLGSTDASIQTKRIDSLSSKRIQIGFEDSGGCMMIYYVHVYFKRCTTTVQGLANFSTTLTGPTPVSLVKTYGRCVNNAIWEGSSIGPSLHCDSKGEWQLPGEPCQCIPGHEPNSDFTGCMACGKYMYKSTVGNGVCTRCPSYSSTGIEGSVECGCDFGYFRAPADKTSSPCSRPPSRPEEIQYHIKDTSVDIEWSSPVYSGGRNDIYYSISCHRCDSTYTRCSDCSDDVIYIPGGPTLLQPEVSVVGLQPHTYYTFRVYSHNGVSATSGMKPMYIEAKLKTSEPVPSVVRSVRLISSTDTTLYLTWKAPSRAEGRITAYEVHVSSESRRVSRISRSYKVASLSIIVEGLPPDEKFLVKVRAQNDAGFGPFSSPVSVGTLQAAPSSFLPPNVRNSQMFDVGNVVISSRKNHDAGYPLAGIIIGVLCAVIVSIAIVVFVFRAKMRHEKFGCENVEVHPFFDNPAELLYCNATQPCYVDPSSYENRDQAVTEFAREIDRSKLKMDDLYISGYFGDTRKGFLRPTSFIYDDLITTSTPIKPANLSVTVKVLKPNADLDERSAFLEEALVIGQFHHPNVVRLEGVVSATEPVMIITEWAEKGPLDEFLQEHRLCGSDIDATQLIHMLHDVSDGMRYLSQIGFVHTNLATKNILVTGQLVCKISGFSSNKSLEPVEGEKQDVTVHTDNISIRYTAPEAIVQQSFSAASDVWSFGVVAWEVLTIGERPYWEMSNRDILHYIDCGYRLPPPPFCPRTLHNIMLNCWNIEPIRRPTFNQISTQLDNLVLSPENMQDTINNIPKSEQPECVPELLDISSLWHWLEDMNMSHYKDVILRHGCVTAEQIMCLTANQLDDMGITDPSMQRILLDGAELLHHKLQHVSVIGIGITV